MRASRFRQNLSRPFRPRWLIALLPRALAWGLSPGLRSAGPLGRWENREVDLSPSAALSLEAVGQTFRPRRSVVRR
jgi:hypothetical protein